MRAEPQSETPGLLEKVFVCSGLLLSTGAFMSLAVARGQGAEAVSGQVGPQLMWLAIYLGVSFLLLWKCRVALKDFVREYPLIALVLFALGSTLWSDDPAMSLRRGLAMAFTCLLGAYIGSRFTLREQLRLLAYVAFVCVIFSLVFGVLGLGNPVDDIPNAWYGIFVHKNTLGRMMVLSILIFFISAKAEPEKKARFWFAAGLALLLLLLSRSATSLVVLAAMFGFLIISPLLRRSKTSLIKASVVILTVGATGIYWVSQNLDAILKLFGKDVTLTGRLQLWILSTVMALQTPWLGHGYSAFWLGPGSASERILAVVQWDAPHAHNGLLELWLEIGLVGVALFLAGFIAYVGWAIMFFRQNSAPESVWPLCFLFFMFISNLTESDFLARNTIFLIVYVAVAIRLNSREEASKRPILQEAKPPLMRASPRACEG